MRAHCLATIIVTRQRQVTAVYAISDAAAGLMPRRFRSFVFFYSAYVGRRVCCHPVCNLRDTARSILLPLKIMSITCFWDLAALRESITAKTHYPDIRRMLLRVIYESFSFFDTNLPPCRGSVGSTQSVPQFLHWVNRVLTFTCKNADSSRKKEMEAGSGNVHSFCTVCRNGFLASLARELRQDEWNTMRFHRGRKRDKWTRLRVKDAMVQRSSGS